MRVLMPGMKIKRLAIVIVSVLLASLAAVGASLADPVSAQAAGGS